MLYPTLAFKKMFFRTGFLRTILGIREQITRTYTDKSVEDLDALWPVASVARVNFFETIGRNTFTRCPDMWGKHGGKHGETASDQTLDALDLDRIWIGFGCLKL